MSMDLAQLMMCLGLSRTEATMVIPLAWYTPTITDRYSSSSIAMVRGIQRYLQLPVTGQIDAATNAAVSQRLGASWQTLNWNTIARRLVATKGAVSVVRAPLTQSAQPMSGVLSDMVDKLKSAVTAPASGICLAKTTDALTQYKDVQRACNRILSYVKRPLLQVDGQLGPATVTAVNQCYDAGQNISSYDVGGNFSNCAEIAAQASAIIQQLTQWAYFYNMPAVGDPPSTHKASVARADGTVENPTAAELARAHSSGGLIALALSPIGLLLIGGLVAWKKGLLDDWIK